MTTTYKDAEEVNYFNNTHKTLYTKTDIDRIYWICDIYKLKTADSISYAHNCHQCGVNLNIIGDEFCSLECTAKYNSTDPKSNECFWKKKCKMCNKTYKIDKTNYNDYEYSDSDDLFENMDEEDEKEEEKEEEEDVSLINPNTIPTNDDLYAEPSLKSNDYYISSDEESHVQLVDTSKLTEIPEISENIFELMNRLFVVTKK
jgi:hypothetical protein